MYSAYIVKCPHTRATHGGSWQPDISIKSRACNNNARVFKSDAPVLIPRATLFVETVYLRKLHFALRGPLLPIWGVHQRIYGGSFYLFSPLSSLFSFFFSIGDNPKKNDRSRPRLTFEPIPRNRNRPSGNRTYSLFVCYVFHRKNRRTLNSIVRPPFEKYYPCIDPCISIGGLV